jgi:uncharacterized peroxidase-related enzyme
MSRIRLLEKEEMEPDIAEMVEELEKTTGDSTAMRVMAHRADILRSFAQFYWNLQMEGMLDRKLVELVRLGIAQINQCPNCLAGRYQDAIDQGFTEDLVRRLPLAEASDRFTPREKAAIAFGQKMARDHRSVTDDDFARLHQHFSEKEIVELCMLVAQFIGIGRVFAVVDAWNPACEIAASG